MHDSLAGPMTCGVLRPAIVLPRDAECWEAADLERAVVHEVEHVRRRDWLTNCLARSICAAYWFHPLVWMAWRRLLVEAERSADDAVLERSEATAYADQLVGLAERVSACAKSPSPAMANRADLAARIAAVLDARQQRGRAGAYRLSLVCAAGALLLASLAPLRMVAAAQAGDGNVVVTAARLQARSALVLELVQVFDSGGRNLEDLSARDFAITEDGVPQNISVFELQKVTAAQAGQNIPTSYYVLGYYAGPARVERQLRQVAISVKGRPNLKLEYRPSYYAQTFDGPAFGGVPDRERAGALDPSIQVPLLIFKKEPEYSEEARKAKYQGTVVLKVDVSVTGRATNIKVIRGLGLGLDEKAIEAVGQWRFRPAMKNGRPVALQLQVAVDFRLM